MTQDYLTTLPHRAVLAITGPEARSFLQRVITHGPEGVTPERAMLSALLTPQGKVLADLIIFDDGEGGLFFDVPASEADALLKRFTLYRLRADAALERREDLSVIAASGEGEAELRTVALAASPDPRNAAIGWRAIAPAGGPASDLDAYHAARIKAGAPEMGMDFGPAEVFSTDVNHDLLGGIDYKKGCFVGQEVASRMHRKGGVRKRTLRLSTQTQAQPGDAVQAGDVSLGAVSSVAPGCALARVRVDRLKDALSDGAPLTLGGAPARVIDDLDAL
ncbi:CAF17-like 4Fe-4S cluster assembly/insertion protein YgfZ [Oceanicaulis sp.]|uniref:CAF17-like 4Fe-4S cluster assembly/insertion protein YgfZ n=1 Tax=Oceanicaulis sp. TaxID=1924941 RepID=UPI003F71F7BA